MIELIVELDPVCEHDDHWSMVVRCVTDIKQSDRFTQAVPYKVEFDENRTAANTINESVFQ